MSENLTDKQNEQTPKQGKCECDDFCIEQLYLILDGEAEAEKMERLKAHIAECKNCCDHYTLELTIREVLQEKIEKKCPKEVINLIKAKISPIA